MEVVMEDRITLKWGVQKVVFRRERKMYFAEPGGVLICLKQNPSGQWYANSGLVRSQYPSRYMQDALDVFLNQLKPWAKDMGRLVAVSEGG
jgi:hypothetical protein